MCEKLKRTEAGAGPGPMKRRVPEPDSPKPRARDLETCSWKEELQSRSCVILRLRSREIIHPAPGHIYNPN